MEEVINGILIREVETKNIMTKSSVASQSYIELSDAKIERSRQCYYVSACT